LARGTGAIGKKLRKRIASKEVKMFVVILRGEKEDLFESVGLTIREGRGGDILK